MAISAEEYAQKLKALATVRLAEALAAERRGWRLTPLKGKRPLLNGWQRLPAPSAEQVRQWALEGNLGLRTGPASGIYVVDEDRAKGGALPGQYTTPTVETGGGGRHFYFVAPTPCPGNSSSKIAPHVDTRGDGGQVVFVGSVHPETGEPYRWAEGLSIDEVPPIPVPDEILAALAPKPVHIPTSPLTGTSRYADAALARELSRLADAPEGQRNDTLNRCAYSLGQLVGGECLERAPVESRLLSAAIAVGLPESEASRTIASGLRSGIAQPRRPVIRAVVTKPRAAPPPDESPEIRLPEILIPGAHVTEDGEYIEIGADDFARDVLSALPPGALYRRAAIVGTLTGEPGTRRFSPASNPHIRLVIDEHMRLVRWKPGKAGGPPVRIFRPCDRDSASLVLAAAETDPTVRALRMLVSYPVATRPDFDIAAPLWNESTGIFYDEPAALSGLQPSPTANDCVRPLMTLLTDFPFAGLADFANYVGLMLTPIIRPALDGNVPLHLIVAPLERTGKTKLAETVLGGVVLGSPTPATQLSGSEEERDKRILSLLLAGDTILHLDNLHDLLDSGSLASLVTSRVYQGRLLGHSSITRLPNDLTIVGTGNNVRTSPEIAKRSIPVRLAPATDAPEERTKFAHPDLPGYIAENRRTLLAALLGAIALWREQRTASPCQPLGGFEEWSAAVGGILAAIGLTEWRTNERQWRRAADSWGEDLAAFAAAWLERRGTEWTNISDLLSIADAAGAFQSIIRGDTQKGRETSFGMRVMRRMTDVPTGAHIIRRERLDKGSNYRMEENT